MGVLVVFSAAIMGQGHFDASCLALFKAVFGFEKGGVQKLWPFQ